MTWAAICGIWPAGQSARPPISELDLVAHVRATIPLHTDHAQPALSYACDHCLVSLLCAGVLLPCSPAPGAASPGHGIRNSPGPGGNMVRNRRARVPVSVCVSVRSIRARVRVQNHRTSFSFSLQLEEGALVHLPCVRTRTCAARTRIPRCPPNGTNAYRRTEERSNGRVHEFIRM